MTMSGTTSDNVWSTSSLEQFFENSSFLLPSFSEKMRWRKGWTSDNEWQGVAANDNEWLFQLIFLFFEH